MSVAIFTSCCTDKCLQNPHKEFWNFKEIESIIDATIEGQRGDENGVKYQ